MGQRSFEFRTQTSVTSTASPEAVYDVRSSTGRTKQLENLARLAEERSAI